MTDYYFKGYLVQQYLSSILDFCFIGIGSTILPDVTIGFGSIIMAHGLIKKNIDELGIYDQRGILIAKREFDKKLFYWI